MRLVSLALKRRESTSSAEVLIADLVRRANVARDEERFAQASALYGVAVAHLPERGDLHVQFGNMLRMIGDTVGAEQAYRAAEAIMPRDPDLRMQLGLLFKSAGRFGDAEAAYRAALAMDSTFQPAQEELAQLYRTGWKALAPPATVLPGPLAAETRTSGVTRDLLPRSLDKLLLSHEPGLEWRRLGRHERTFWGTLPVLRGVEAIRGFFIAARPILHIELLLSGQLIYRGRPTGGHPLPLEADDPEHRKYVFNVWLDVSLFAHGAYDIEMNAVDVAGDVLSRRERVVIAPPPPSSLAPESDSVVAPEDPHDARPLDEQINSRPSSVRSPHRSLLIGAPRAVLVQRADQLGDLVVSVPAIRRVRTLFPNAQLIGLVSRANRELAETLGLFDHLVAIDFPADEIEGRRVMSLADQEALAKELAAFRIDLAIDLSEAEASRLLLPLAGAPLNVGFRSGQFPGLDVDFSANTYDKCNDHEIAPHAKKALGLVNWLAVLMDPTPNLAVRTDLDRNRLKGLGLRPEVPFAVLHAGARARFSRWPHYAALAERIVRDTDLQVVLLTTDTEDEGRLSEALRSSERFHLIDRRLDFNDFDALASFCSVFIGDDSGPKHLASLRGSQVISVQTARNNWLEWGQDSSGYIITRRVPCAGCLIQNDQEAQECGRAFVCLTAITPDEVFRAVQQLLLGKAQ